jgi:hypothetical protein
VNGVDANRPGKASQLLVDKSWDGDRCRNRASDGSIGAEPEPNKVSVVGVRGRPRHRVIVLEDLATGRDLVAIWAVKGRPHFEDEEVARIGDGVDDAQDRRADVSRGEPQAGNAHTIREGALFEGHRSDLGTANGGC